MRVSLSLAAAQSDPLVAAAQGFGVPGLAIALVAPGRRSLFLHGVSQPGSGRAVGPDTWFSVASLGKHVTAAAVLDLAQRGLVDLGGAIGDYLPDLPTAWADRSVESLLHHTSGLPEYLAHQPDQPVPATRAGFMSTYGALAPAFGEGEGWMYTNTNYILAGMLVAQREGRPFAAAVQALLDRTCGQGGAVAGPAWARLANEDAARAGTADSDSAQREVAGDGDVCFTPQGALAWLEALVEGRLLEARHTNLMLTPAAQVTGRPALYGCGWFLEPLRDATFAHHGGHFDGWTAMAIVNPAAGSGVIAMCNLAPRHTRHIRHLAQSALEAFCPGSTPLSLQPIVDDAPGLTARIRQLLIRDSGAGPDLDSLADELRRVAEHGSAVRSVPNLYAGVQPERFELVERHVQPAQRWHRYRLTYADRVEHLLVGLTPEDRVHWAWGM